jgi:hypothetical protein
MNLSNPSNPITQRPWHLLPLEALNNHDALLIGRVQNRLTCEVGNYKWNAFTRIMSLDQGNLLFQLFQFPNTDEVVKNQQVTFIQE